MLISNVWAKALQVTKQKTGRVIKYVCRFPEGELPPDQLKALVQSVYTEGHKAAVRFSILSEDQKELEAISIPCWIRKISIGMAKEGRVVQIQFYFSEEHTTETTLAALSGCIETDGSNTLALQIEPVPERQLEMPGSHADASVN